MKFFNLSLMATLTTILLCSCTEPKVGGLALYTVRDAMEENAKETMKMVSETGYQYVEAAGYKDGLYYGMSPKDFKTYAKSQELDLISTHQSSITLANADQQMADAKAVGFEYFVVPIPPMGFFKFNSETMEMGMTTTPKNLADILNQLGKKAHDNGLKLLYHNHDFEFKKDSTGVVPIVYLLENCDPKYVNFEMDLYWVVKAGADPLTYFEKYPGRFKIWHVKDMDEEGRFAAVGTGTIDFKPILAAKEQAGMEYYMVEQDLTYTMKPLEAIKVSHKGLQELGFN